MDCSYLDELTQCLSKLQELRGRSLTMVIDCCRAVLTLICTSTTKEETQQACAVFKSFLNFVVHDVGAAVLNGDHEAETEEQQAVMQPVTRCSLLLEQIIEGGIDREAGAGFVGQPIAAVNVSCPAHTGGIKLLSLQGLEYIRLQYSAAEASNPKLDVAELKDYFVRLEPDLHFAFVSHTWCDTSSDSNRRDPFGSPAKVDYIIRRLKQEGLQYCWIDAACAPVPNGIHSSDLPPAFITKFRSECGYAIANCHAFIIIDENCNKAIDTLVTNLVLRLKYCFDHQHPIDELSNMIYLATTVQKQLNLLAEANFNYGGAYSSRIWTRAERVVAARFRRTSQHNGPLELVQACLNGMELLLRLARQKVDQELRTTNEAKQALASADIENAPTDNYVHDNTDDTDDLTEAEELEIEREELVSALEHLADFEATVASLVRRVGSYTATCGLAEFDERLLKVLGSDLSAENITYPDRRRLAYTLLHDAYSHELSFDMDYPVVLLLMMYGLGVGEASDGSPLSVPQWLQQLDAREQALLAQASTMSAAIGSASSTHTSVSQQVIDWFSAHVVTSAAARQEFLTAIKGSTMKIVLAAFCGGATPNSFYRTITTDREEDLFLGLVQRPRSYVGVHISNTDMCADGPAQLRDGFNSVLVRFVYGSGTFPSANWDECRGAARSRFSFKLSQASGSTGDLLHATIE
eukprot:m.224639 g.224639  ORF g.224639 m.224639 type:complete len:694 (+) comp17294_c0_seq1:156-2237(+)